MTPPTPPPTPGSLHPPAGRRPGGVPAPAAWMATHRVVGRQLVTRGRLVGLGALGVVALIVAWAVGASSELYDHHRAAVDLVQGLGLTLVVPIVALVFASAALGDLRDDGTLVYLWLRPLDRWPVVAGAWSAAVLVIVPLTVVPVAGSALLARGGGDVVVAAALAALVGGLAYAAVFVLLSLMVRRVIVWGLAYVVVWEGVAGSLGTTASRLAIRGYTRSILADRTATDLAFADQSWIRAGVVCLVLVVVVVALAAVRLSRLDVD